MSQRITKTIFLTAAEAAAYKSTGTCQHVTPDGDTITVSDTDTDYIVYCPEDEPATKAELAEAVKHHYSTTEQVVGTFIDGKPIYEKTITHVFSASEQFQYNANMYRFDISNAIAENVDKIWLYDSSRSDNMTTNQNNFTDIPYSLSLYIQFDNNDKFLIAIIGNSLKQSTIDVVTYYATIRYTKTTD